MTAKTKHRPGSVTDETIRELENAYVMMSPAQRQRLDQALQDIREMPDEEAPEYDTKCYSAAKEEFARYEHEAEALSIEAMREELSAWEILVAIGEDDFNVLVCNNNTRRGVAHFLAAMRFVQTLRPDYEPPPDAILGRSAEAKQEVPR